MRAELKRIHSPDVHDLEKFRPAERDDFGVLLQLMVSPENGEGEESFDVTLCTPRWLLQNHRESDIVFGLHHLIVFEYNYRAIFSRLKRTVEGVEADTWAEVAAKLSRIGRWEFENYREAG